MSLAKNTAPERAPAILAGILVLVYSALLTLVIAFMGLWSSVSMLRRPKYREGLGERFGSVRPDLAADVSGRRVIWVHAVSVGEVLAASRLVKELGEALGEGWEIVVSTTTHTGQALARERFGAERVFFMPIDFGFSMRAYLNALKPEAVVLIESEVWPRMMYECGKCGIPVVVVNARVSDRSFKRSMKVRWLWSRVLRRATLWLAQSEEDARRLVELGAPADAVRVGGNLKYDVRASKQSNAVKLVRKAADVRPVIVAGSTVEIGGTLEESLVLRAWQRTFGTKLDPLLVLAPRHPERFHAVEVLAAAHPYVRASDSLPAPKGNGWLDIVLLDTIGDLAGVYAIADIAFVGGSLLPRGGHNPLEPAQFGVPVVMGPSVENFRDIVGSMQSAGAISIVDNEDALAREFVKLLNDRGAARAMGERGRKVFEEQQGATKHAVDAIVELVKP